MDNIRNLCKKYNLQGIISILDENLASDYEEDLKIFEWMKNNNSQELLSFILEYKSDYFKLEYCRRICDKKEVWEKIISDYWKYLYCLYVCDRQEIWSTISSDEWKSQYCLKIKDRKEVWTTIDDDEWKYAYCRSIQDRHELSSTINSEIWKNKYEKWKKEKINV